MEENCFLTKKEDCWCYKDECSTDGLFYLRTLIKLNLTLIILKCIIKITKGRMNKMKELLNCKTRCNFVIQNAVL